ncbi:hypothetical protein OG422_04895 [Streptomyces sp. NBC_01525]|uniref:hypothetical protein n=1 Tax=Streptomyces sp. NBC_01525 TaxID=2903893 RepID=UPI003862D6AE
MADPTTWPELLNSFFQKGTAGSGTLEPIPALEDVTKPPWTRAYWNYALGRDPWQGMWVTRYDNGRSVEMTAGVGMVDGDKDMDGKDSPWPRLNMGSSKVLTALAGSGTDVTSIPSFTYAEQQLQGAIQYFNNYHIGLDQWRAKLDNPESGWKGSASAAFADVLLRLSRAFEEIDNLTGGPSGSGGYLGAINQAGQGLRAAVNEMQEIYTGWQQQPAWSPYGAVQQILSRVGVNHKDNPGNTLAGTTQLTLDGQEIGYIDQEATWQAIEAQAKQLWLQTAQQHLNGMVGDVHIKLAQAYNTATLALKPVPTSIENAINGGGYGGSTTPPPKPPGTDDDKNPDKDTDKDKDLPPNPEGNTGDGNGDTGNLDPGNTGDGTGGGTGDLNPGQTGDGNGTGDFNPGHTGDGTGGGTGDLNPGQTGDGNGTGDFNPGHTGDGTGGGTGDLNPGQTGGNDRNQYIPPYLRHPGNVPPPGNTDRRNPYRYPNNRNTTYKPPPPGRTDTRRWTPDESKKYTPPPVSSNRFRPGTSTGSGNIPISSNGTGGTGGSSGGTTGTNGANGVRSPIATSSSGGKNGSSVPVFPPMANGMGGGKGQENQERERTTWLAEDASVWGTDPEMAPTVLGRPGTQLFADTAYLGETDEWQSAPGPYGERPGTSGGGPRTGQGGAGESRQGQRDGYGQGSSAQRHG